MIDDPPVSVNGWLTLSVSHSLLVYLLALKPAVGAAGSGERNG